jgi:hypothetical protein
LSLGIFPALDESGCVLYPVKPSCASERPSLVFEIPNTTDEKTRYTPLKFRCDHDPLVRPGIVEIDLPEATQLDYWRDLDPLEAGAGDRPPSLAETDDEKRLITWIRIRLPEANGEATPTRQLTAQISWLGINAAEVIQRARVVAERLPNGTGEPDQSAAVVNTPVLLDSVRLTVNGETWRQIDELAAAPPEVSPQTPRLASQVLSGNGNGDRCRYVPTLGKPSGSEQQAEAGQTSDAKVFTIDRDSGEIRFGDGAHGMRPPAGATIQISYDYGGGPDGLVGIGSIKKMGDARPQGLEVSNPVPTWGASQAETVTEAEKRLPSLLRHRDRLVSVGDIKDIAWRTPGVELGRVEVKPLYHPTLGPGAQGLVTVLAVPRNDPAHPDTPEADPLFLQTICEYLEPRRILTTELHVVGPDYKPIWVSIGIVLVPGYDAGPVRESVRRALQRFLSPLHGGFEGEGWPLGKDVDVQELLSAASRVTGVAKINILRLGDSSSDDMSSVEIGDLQLPRLVTAVVEVGDAPTLQEVRGEIEAPEQVPAVMPIPVVPKEC